MFDVLETAKVTVTNLDQYKPRAKTLMNIDALAIIPNKTVLSAKADGEFSVIRFTNEISFVVNLWGTQRSNFRALNELAEFLKARSISSATLLSEMYAMKNGEMLRLPDFEHIVKSGSSQQIDEQVFLGIFDIVELNGKAVNETYEWKLDELSTWITDKESRVHVLPYIKPQNHVEAQNFWNIMVQGGPHYEGVFARSNGDLYKIKPILEVDAVIIAINKAERFRFDEVTSFKVALMDWEGILVELGDVASGIEIPLRKKLWELMLRLKITEDEKEVWIQPYAIVNVQFTQTFTQTMRRWKFTNGQYIADGTQQFHTMRHPRLIRFRPEKQVNPTDLRLEQLA